MYTEVQAVKPVVSVPAPSPLAAISSHPPTRNCDPNMLDCFNLVQSIVADGSIHCVDDGVALWLMMVCAVQLFPSLEHLNAMFAPHEHVPRPRSLQRPK